MKLSDTNCQKSCIEINLRRTLEQFTFVEEIMKKLLFLLALSAATPTLKPVFAGEQAALFPALAPAPDGAPFHWQLRLKTGQKFLTTTDTNTESSQQMPATPGKPATGAPLTMNSTSKTHMTIEQNVLSSDEKGARVEVVYRDITQTSVMRVGDKVVYDSAHPPDSLKNMGDMFKGMIGARVSYLVSPGGQISDVQGVEEYLKHMSEGMDKGAGQTPEEVAQRKTMREAVKGFLSPDMIRYVFGETYRAMPKAPVAHLGSWKYTSAIPLMGTTFTQSGQGTFLSRADGLVTIAQKGELSTDGGAEFKVPGVGAGTAQNPAPVTQLDLSGTSSGQITLDETSGLTMNSRTEQNMEGDLVMYGLVGKGSTMTIPMKMKTEATSQTEEVKTTPSPTAKSPAR